jgi:hypothetical protein
MLNDGISEGAIKTPLTIAGRPDEAKTIQPPVRRSVLLFQKTQSARYNFAI